MLNNSSKRFINIRKLSQISSGSYGYGNRFLPSGWFKDCIKSSTFEGQVFTSTPRVDSNALICHLESQKSSLKSLFDFENHLHYPTFVPSFTAFNSTLYRSLSSSTTCQDSSSSSSSTRDTFFNDNPYGDDSNEIKWGQDETDERSRRGAEAAREELKRRKPDENLVRRAQSQGVSLKVVEFDVSASEALKAFKEYQSRACRGFQAPMALLHPRDSFEPLGYKVNDRYNDNNSGNYDIDNDRNSKKSSLSEQETISSQSASSFSPSQSPSASATINDQTNYSYNRSVSSSARDAYSSSSLRGMNRHERYGNGSNGTYYDGSFGNNAYTRSHHLSSVLGPRRISSVVLEVFQKHVDSQDLTPVMLPFWCFDVEYSSYCVSARLGFPEGGKEASTSSLFYRDLSTSERESLSAIANHSRVSKDNPTMQVLGSFRFAQDVGKGIAAQHLPSRTRVLTKVEIEQMRSTADLKQRFDREEKHSKVPFLHRLFGGEIVTAPDSVPFEAPDMRQGIAWQFASRALADLDGMKAAEALKSMTKAIDVKNVTIRLKVFRSLYYFSSFFS